MDSGDVRRGVCRWLVQSGGAPLAEVRLGSGRRVDVMAVDADGRITLVEIKVSLADLRGDRKWPEYLDWCDRFFWAVPANFDSAILEQADFRPLETGVIRADRYGAIIDRPALLRPLNAARRRAQTLQLARVAAMRMMAATDPEAMGFDQYL